MTQNEVHAMGNIIELQYRKARSAMAFAGVKNSEIAEIEDVSLTYVTYVLTGRRKGYRIRRAIAKKCGVPYEEIWIDEADPELPAAA
jgi:hypothetical protein